MTFNCVRWRSTQPDPRRRPKAAHQVPEIARHREQRVTGTEAEAILSLVGGFRGRGKTAPLVPLGTRPQSRRPSRRRL